MGKIISVIKPREAKKIGDVNGDGVVDEKDLSEVHKDYAAEKKERAEEVEAAEEAKKALDVVNEDEVKATKSKGRSKRSKKIVTD